MQVREVMSAKVEWITPDLSIQETAQKMRDIGMSCLPVRENDRLIGLITEHDITYRAVAIGTSPAATKVRDVMSAEVTCCFDDQDVAEAAHIMEDRHLRGLPVVDHQEHVVGVLSLEEMAFLVSHESLGKTPTAASESVDVWITQYLELYGREGRGA